MSVIFFTIRLFLAFRIFTITVVSALELTLNDCEHPRNLSIQSSICTSAVSSKFYSSFPSVSPVSPSQIWSYSVQRHPNIEVQVHRLVPQYFHDRINSCQLVIFTNKFWPNFVSQSHSISKRTPSNQSKLSGKSQRTVPAHSLGLNCSTIISQTFPTGNSRLLNSW